jgi:hypothetical protein
MSKERKPALLHPFLFAVFPILFLYSRNMGEFPLSVILVPALESLLFTAVGLTVVRLVTGCWRKAGLLASSFLIIFYSYGHLRIALYALPVDLDVLPLKAHTILFPFGVIALAIITMNVLVSRSSFENHTRILNAAAVLLVVVSLVEIGVYKLTTREAERFEVDHSLFGPTDWALTPPPELPDIYYIVLDAYPREDNLLELYGYDNSGFLEFLSSRGFFVAREATSNYSRTILSLASSLNFEYMDGLAGLVGEGQTNLKPIRDLIEDSRARDILSRFGYRFVALRSGFQNTELKGADAYLTPGQRGEFESALLRTTAASPVNAWLLRVSGTVAGQYRESDRHRIRYAFEMIPEAARNGRPDFVFAHIVAPHPPFVFDRGGGDVEDDRYFAFKSSNDLIRPDGLTRSRYRDRFLDQLVFINGEVEALIDTLISDSRVPPVIILRGDHGPGTFSHHSRLDCTYLGDRMSILFAMRVPCTDGGLLYDSMTPVNAFRIILNGCFGGSFPMLEDRNFYTTRENPYRFVEVTGRIGDSEDRRRLEILKRLGYYPQE